ncbi:hypothetical protein [Candidatus Borrarchaeum sp.]|uniref:hypothetical protein n=1 Tax=Candidatus Borrarchaeum sp. TaxID=2846742 RepID=UPI00257C54FB|nr:hypothetical protein [Candidatus Borrarchaeum sp.]
MYAEGALGGLAELLPQLATFIIKKGKSVNLEERSEKERHIFTFISRYDEVTPQDILKREEHAEFGIRHVPAEHIKFMIDNSVVSAIEQLYNAGTISSDSEDFKPKLKEFRGISQKLEYLRFLPRLDMDVLREEGRLMELRDKSLEEVKQFNLTYDGPSFTMENILESVSEYTSWMHLFRLIPKLVAKGVSIKDMIEKTHEVTDKSVDAQPIATPAEKLKSIENTLETILQGFDEGIFESDIPTEDVTRLIQEILDILRIQMSNPTDYMELYEVLGKGGFRHSPRFKKLNSPTYLVVNTQSAKEVFFS